MTTISLKKKSKTVISNCGLNLKTKDIVVNYGFNVLRTLGLFFSSIPSTKQLNLSFDLVNLSFVCGESSCVVGPRIQSISPPSVVNLRVW